MFKLNSQFTYLHPECQSYFWYIILRYRTWGFIHNTYFHKFYDNWAIHKNLICELQYLHTPIHTQCMFITIQKQFKTKLRWIAIFRHVMWEKKRVTCAHAVKATCACKNRVISFRDLWKYPVIILSNIFHKLYMLAWYLRHLCGLRRKQIVRILLNASENLDHSATH